MGAGIQQDLEGGPRRSEAWPWWFDARDQRRPLRVAMNAQGASIDGNPRIKDVTVDIGCYEGIAEIFSDGFESGQTTNWTVTSP